MNALSVPTMIFTALIASNFTPETQTEIARSVSEGVGRAPRKVLNCWRTPGNVQRVLIEAPSRKEAWELAHKEAKNKRRNSDDKDAECIGLLTGKQ